MSKPIAEESDHAKAGYYHYEKAKPLLRRLISIGSKWPVYCERCAKPVPIGSVVLGFATTLQALKSPLESTIVKHLRQQNWSVLKTAERPMDWYRQPNLRIELGRCESCSGPFCAFGKRQGLGRDQTLYFGAVFLGELDSPSTVSLLEIALEQDLFASEDFLKKAVAICKTLGSNMNVSQFFKDREQRNAALRTGQRAMLHMQHGKLELAREELKSALQTYNETGTKRDQAVTARLLATVNLQLGDFADAEWQLERSLALAEELDHKEDIALCFGLMGTIRFQKTEFDIAEQMFLRALETVRAAGDSAGVATAFGELGRVYVAQNKYSQAKDAYAQALDLWQQLGETQGARIAKEALRKLEQ